MKTFRSAYDQSFSATSPESLVTATTRVRLRHKESGAIIPVGTEFSVLFGRVGGRWALRASGVITIGSGESEELAHVTLISRRVSDFFAAPNLEDLAGEELHSGACPSVLGETVEPDGCDHHGSPSWLMALGLV